MHFKIQKTLSSSIGFVKTYKLPLISGLLQATSYIPFPPWALFFSLVPLWVFWIKADFKKRIIGTLVCSFVACFIGFYWVAITAHDFGKLPWVVSILALVLFSLLANLHLVVSALVWGVLKLQVSKRHGLWLLPFITTLSMCFTPTLFPWNFGYAWIYVNLPGAQLADIFGVVSLATVTIFINFLIFLGYITKRYSYYGLGAFVIFISINAMGLLRLNFVPLEKNSLRVLITQANIGNLEKQRSLNGYGFRQKIISKYLNLTTQALKQDKNIDLIVWPETAYPLYINLLDFENTAPELFNLTKNNQVALATGYYDVQNNDQVANAILYIDKNGYVIDRPTHKSILLAFGEYLPFGAQFPKLKALLPQVADFKRGPGPSTRTIGNITFGPLICYESLFTNFSRALANQGSHIFINLTNDSWYDPWFEPKQHLYITAGRALENRRPIIRSTNTGLSTVIQSNGQPMKISPRGKEWTGIYDIKYPDLKTNTIYQKWGKNTHHLVLVLFVLLIYIHGRFKKPR